MGAPPTPVSGPPVYVTNASEFPAGGGGGTTATPSVTQTQDATTTAKQNVIPQGDGTTNTQNGGVVNAFGYVFNGTTWDRARGNAAQGQQMFGTVGGRTIEVQPGTANIAAAHTAGQVVYLATLTNLLPAAPDGTFRGLIQSVQLAVKNTTAVGFKIYFFTSNPTASAFTGNTTPAVAAADLPKVRGPYALSVGDSGLGTGSTAETIYTNDSIGKSLVAPAATIYALLVVTGAITFATTSDLILTVAAIPD